jgi:hypothetical protein
MKHFCDNCNRTEQNLVPITYNRTRKPGTTIRARLCEPCLDDLRTDDEYANITTAEPIAFDKNKCRYCQTDTSETLDAESHNMTYATANRYGKTGSKSRMIVTAYSHQSCRAN